MLFSRLYEPADGEVIYHYCSAATFHAIASSGAIRFSDINMLNDETEVRWAYSVFEEAATRIIKRIDLPPSVPSIDVAFFDAVDEIISPIQLAAHPFVSCFSLEPDSLGQWRAYADDGRGFAIGLDSKKVKSQVHATFLKVLYEREAQVQEMMVALVAIFLARIEKPEDKSGFLENCILLGTLMTAFKHPAFEHEQEVRAIHVVTVDHSTGGGRFVDPGATTDDGIDIEGVPVSFQVRDNHLVAYLDAKLDPAGLGSPVKEVVLGPKNHSAAGNIFLFLGGAGISDVTLRRSIAPYR
jgi:hypothetical protein